MPPSKNQCTGKAVIRVNGKELRAFDDATLDIGGVEREAVKGSGKVFGFKEATKEPSMECKIAHKQDTDLVELGAIVDATVIFESDTGDTYILRDAFVTETPKLNAQDGSVDLKFSAISCTRM
jgi:hypothetical protein